MKSIIREISEYTTSTGIFKLVDASPINICMPATKECSSAAFSFLRSVSLLSFFITSSFSIEQMSRNYMPFIERFLFRLSAIFQYSCRPKLYAPNSNTCSLNICSHNIRTKVRLCSTLHIVSFPSLTIISSFINPFFFTPFYTISQSLNKRTTSLNLDTLNGRHGNYVSTVKIFYCSSDIRTYLVGHRCHSLLDFSCLLALQYNLRLSHQFRQ